MLGFEIINLTVPAAEPTWFVVEAFYNVWEANDGLCLCNGHRARHRPRSVARPGANVRQILPEVGGRYSTTMVPSRNVLGGEPPAPAPSKRVTWYA